MPPKNKFKRENIESIAFNYVRKHGWDTLSTRYIAQKLGSSTRPIYTYFSSMIELKAAVMKRVLDLYHDFQSTARSDDVFLDMGLGIIVFAQKEPHLFRFMYDAQNMQIKKKYDEEFFNKALEKLGDYQRFKEFSEEMRKEFMFTMYVFSLGVAKLIESEWADDWTEEDIVSFLRNTGLKQYYGFLKSMEQDEK